MPNTENILKVADAIENHTIEGLGFNMGNFIGSADAAHADKTGHNCGTIACVAGWSYAVRNGGVKPEPVDVEDFKWEVDGEWFGLETQKANILFYGYPGDGDSSPKPEKAVAVLRHLAATGEVDWTVEAPVAA